MSCSDLEREQDHGETDHCGDAHSYDDRLRVIEAGDHSHHVGEAQCQDGLENRRKSNSLISCHTFNISLKISNIQLYI